MSNTTIKTERTFTGWHMLAIMLTFFGVIFTVNFYMAFSAVSTWTGLVVENSYVASQEFNTKLANARAQKEMGWQGGLSYADNTLTFSLRDNMGAPLNPESVVIEVSRPIGTKGDQSLTLIPVANGDYISLLDLAPGVWNAAIIANFADAPPYEHHARLIVETIK